MGLDYSNYGSGKFVYMPKVSESIEISIKEIRETRSGLEKFHFTKKEKVALPDGTMVDVPKSLGYHIECELTDGKVLSITSLAAFIQVFVKNKLQDGDKVKISHKAKGEWEVVKL